MLKETKKCYITYSFESKNCSPPPLRQANTQHTSPLPHHPTGEVPALYRTDLRRCPCLPPAPQPWAKAGQHPSLLGSHGMSRTQAPSRRPGGDVATLQWAGCWPRMAASSSWGWGMLGREAGLPVAMEGGCSACLTTLTTARPCRHGCYYQRWITWFMLANY